MPPTPQGSATESTKQMRRSRRAPPMGGGGPERRERCRCEATTEARPEAYAAYAAGQRDGVNEADAPFSPRATHGRQRPRAARTVQMRGDDGSAARGVCRLRRRAARRSQRSRCAVIAARHPWEAAARAARTVQMRGDDGSAARGVCRIRRRAARRSQRSRCAVIAARHHMGGSGPERRERCRCEATTEARPEAYAAYAAGQRDGVNEPDAPLSPRATTWEAAAPSGENGADARRRRKRGPRRMPHTPQGSATESTKQMRRYRRSGLALAQTMMTSTPSA